MNKNLIRLTESDLHKIVKESVNRVIKESNNSETYEKLLEAGRIIEQVLGHDLMLSQPPAMISSTQNAIAKILSDAARSIYKAAELYEKNGYNQPIAHA